MNHEDARFLRADRCGILVSEGFNYRKEKAEILWNYLAHFAQLTDTQRGIDTTVEFANSHTTATAREQLEGYLSQIEPEDRKRSGRWLTIKVPVSEGTCTVVTREPDRNPDSLITRGTRTFPVYDLDSRKVLFLKDGWRADLGGMMNEIEILQKLKGANVCHIPHYIKGGDFVGDEHSAASYKFKDEKWRAGYLNELVPRRHYRFLECMVARPLEEFGNPQQLLQVLTDAFDGMFFYMFFCSVH